jgi:hypothetical protein
MTRLADLNTVIDAIEAFWTKIGLTQAEKSQEKDALDASVTKVFTDCLSTLDSRCREIKDKIENVKKEHILLLKMFDDTDSALQRIEKATNKDGSLRQRLLSASRAYDEDKAKYEKLLERLESLKSEAIRLFELLDVSDEEKGEWVTFDVKFSDQKIQSLEALVESLTIDHAMRQDAILNANKEIATFSAELEVEIPNEVVRIFATNSLKHSAIAQVKEYSQRLQALREERIEQISGMAAEIMKLWGLLGVDPKHQQEFLQAYSTVGTSVVEACMKEIQRLKVMQGERLPALVEEQARQIRQYCSTLHIIRPEKDPEDDLQAEFERNEEELKELTDLHQKMAPFLELINQREEALLELQSLTLEEPKAQGKKTERTDPKDEQRKRRAKAVLPRLEKKLFTMCIEFREVNGFDLEWDAEPYVNTLSHVILSSIELKTIRGKARKKSQQPASKQMTTPGSSCAGRRLSENVKLYGNIQ